MIKTIDLFPILNHKLIRLLRELDQDDWERPTVCMEWNVKDIVAHLLDGNLRKISTSRDKYVADENFSPKDYRDLVNYLNNLNAVWVTAAKRLSPLVLIEMLEITNDQVYKFLKSLDPHKPSFYPVAWAGEELSENWFDIAREYTERWLHQQQIRLAVKSQGIMDRELYHPVLQTFMFGLPYTYKNIIAQPGTVIRISIEGEGGGVWYLKFKEEQWKLLEHNPTEPSAEVLIPSGIAWRLFSKGIDVETARQSVQIKGDENLGKNVLNLVAVMA